MRRLLLLLLATVAAADMMPAWERFVGSDGVRVYDDTKIEIVVDGKVWLTSAGAAVHDRGKWWCGPSECAPYTCTTATKATRVTGPPVSPSRNVASLSECCAACDAVPGCTAFTFEKSSACSLLAEVTEEVHEPGATSGRLSRPSNLTLTGSYMTQGTSSGGNRAYVGYAFDWATPEDVFMTTEVRFFDAIASSTSPSNPAISAFSFVVTLLNDTTSSAVASCPHFASFSENDTALCSTDTFSVAFPAFNLSAVSSSMWSLTWKGEFSRAVWGKGIRAFGTLGGPVAIYDPSTTGTQPGGALMFGSARNFKEQVATTNCGDVIRSCGLAFGASGLLNEISAGLEIETLLVFSETGVGDVVRQWGKAMLSLTGVLPFPNSTMPIPSDDLSSNVGFWTDDSGVYGPAHWNASGSQGNPGTVLPQLSNEYAIRRLPMGYIEIDSYWYNKNPGSLFGCQSIAGSDKKLLPAGLAQLVLDLAVKRTAVFVPLFCNGSDVLSKWPHFTSATVWDRSSGQNLSLGAAFPASDFWKSYLTDDVLAGAVGIVIDHVSRSFLLFPDFVSTAGSFAAWLSDLAKAARRLNPTVSVVFRRAIPSDILLASSLAPTAIVANPPTRPDGDHPEGARFSDAIGPALLSPAVGTRVFIGSYWTAFLEQSPHLATILSVMTGMVGSGDRSSWSDFDVLQPAMMLSGKLLQPTNPAVPLGRTFYADQSLTREGLMWYSSTVIPSSSEDFVFYQVLTSGNARFLLSDIRSYDMWPPLSKVGEYVAWSWGSVRCCHNCNADVCVNQSLLTNDARRSETKFTLWNVCPLRSGWAILGEIDKYIAVSPLRVSLLKWTASKPTISAVGTPGEIVNWMWMLPYQESTGAAVIKISTNTMKNTSTILGPIQ